MTLIGAAQDALPPAATRTAAMRDGAPPGRGGSFHLGLADSPRAAPPGRASAFAPGIRPDEDVPEPAPDTAAPPAPGVAAAPPIAPAVETAGIAEAAAPAAGASGMSLPDDGGAIVPADAHGNKAPAAPAGPDAAPDAATAGQPAPAGGAAGAGNDAAAAPSGGARGESADAVTRPPEAATRTAPPAEIAGSAALPKGLSQPVPATDTTDAEHGRPATPATPGSAASVHDGPAASRDGAGSLAGAPVTAAPATAPAAAARQMPESGLSDRPRTPADARLSPQAGAPATAPRPPTPAASAAGQAALQPSADPTEPAASAPPALPELGAVLRETSSSGVPAAAAQHSAPETTRTLWLSGAPGSADAELSLSRSGGGRLDVALSPAELGGLRVELTGDEGRLVLAIHAERPETADLLRRHLDVLATELRAMGFAAAEFAFGQDPRQGQAAASFPAQAATARPRIDASPPEHPSPRTTSARLDLRL